MRSDVIQAIGELIKSGKTEEGSGVSVTVPSFPTDDIYPIFEKYFNANAVKALSTPAKYLIHERNQQIVTPGLGTMLKKLGLKTCQNMDPELGLWRREFDKVHFCSSRADKATLHKAVEKVISVINHLADKGYVTASLMPLSVFSFVPVDRVEPEYAVLSYIAITNAGEQYAMQNFPQMFVVDGEMPKRFNEQ